MFAALAERDWPYAECDLSMLVCACYLLSVSSKKREELGILGVISHIVGRDTSVKPVRTIYFRH